MRFGIATLALAPLLGAVALAGPAVADEPQVSLPGGITIQLGPGQPYTNQPYYQQPNYQQPYYQQPYQQQPYYQPHHGQPGYYQGPYAQPGDARGAQNPAAFNAYVQDEIGRVRNDLRYDIRQGAVSPDAMQAFRTTRQEIQRDVAEAGEKGYISPDDREHIEDHLQDLRQIRNQYAVGAYPSYYGR